jgi:hypothetical protein
VTVSSPRRANHCVKFRAERHRRGDRLTSIDIRALSAQLLPSSGRALREWPTELRTHPRIEISFGTPAGIDPAASQISKYAQGPPVSWVPKHRLSNSLPGSEVRTLPAPTVIFFDRSAPSGGLNRQAVMHFALNCVAVRFPSDLIPRTLASGRSRSSLKCDAVSIIPSSIQPHGWPLQIPLRKLRAQ